MTCTRISMQQIVRSSEIQLLMVVLVAGSPLALAAIPPPLKEGSLTRLSLNDVLFTEDVLLEVLARSRIDCSKKCVETEGCVMCTFLSSPQGPPGHCRLHSQLQTSKDARKSMPGAKSLIRRCDGGFVLTCGRCLRRVSTSVTYTTARQGCSSMQGRLVMPKSRAEVRCLWTFFKPSSTQVRVWVGADDLKSPRVYKWDDGTLLPDNSPQWGRQDGDPDKTYPGNDCVYICAQYTYYIFDEYCGNRYRYVCQKDFV